MNAPDATRDDDAALRALAGRLTAHAGLAKAKGLTRLAGGRNNQVYRLDTESGTPLHSLQLAIPWMYWTGNPRFGF